MSARLPRSTAGPTIRPSSAQDSQAPETLIWRQRTAEEWATSDSDQTAYAAGSGVSLAHAVFQRTPGGDYDDERRYTTAMVAFDPDDDGDGDLMPATMRYWPRPTTMLYRNDGHGVFVATDPGAAGLMEEAGAIAVLDADRDGDMFQRSVAARWPTRNLAAIHRRHRRRKP